MGGTPEDAAVQTYLNDHLAGARAAIDLMDDVIGSATDPSFVAFMRDLRAEVDEDRAQLRTVMARLGASEQRVKQVVASLSEKVAGVKLLGTGASEQLSRLLALETLSAGIWAKRLLWRSLLAADVLRPPLDGVDLEALEARAGRQLDMVEEHRRAAARAALQS